MMHSTAPSRTFGEVRFLSLPTDKRTSNAPTQLVGLISTAVTVGGTSPFIDPSQISSAISCQQQRRKARPAVVQSYFLCSGNRLREAILIGTRASFSC
jgi:hypothetical protein